MRDSLPPAPPTPPPPVRLFDVDWLRVVAILTIFVYHVGRLFDDLEAWHVKHWEVTGWLTFPMVLGSQFMMPLFWVLSGMGTRFALGNHPPAAFVRRRAARLVIPVVTIGWLVSGPIQVYIESTTGQHYHAPTFEGSFWEFLPHYVTDGLYGFGGFFAWNGLHLWYLTYLFVFTLGSMPLFLWLRTPAGGRANARLAGLLDVRGAVYLLALPVIAVEALLPRAVPVLAWGEGGWLLGSHWVYLILGFLLVCDPRPRLSIQRQRWASLTLAVATTVPLALLAPGIDVLVFGTPGFVGFIALRTINGWFWLLAILGFGTAHFNRPGRFLAYAGPAVLPFYVLHQPLIVMLGYLTRTWTAPIPVIYVAVALGTLITSLGLYEYAIRRRSVLRLLFGMNPAPPRNASAGAGGPR